MTSESRFTTQLGLSFSWMDVLSGQQISLPDTILLSKSYITM